MDRHPSPSRFDPPLSFVCVGVPKAGTTSLHEALKRHPNLVLPRGKEAPFFLQPPAQRTPDAWATFVREVFPHTRGVLGKITPQYWYDPDMPEKLAEAFGTALRILVLLRDPVDAVLSAYRMHVRRGEETRPLSVFLEEGLRDLPAARSRYDLHLPAAARILAGGEYARILRRYLEVFPRSSLYVGFFEVLVQDPAAELRKIQAFLGVPPRSLPFPRAHPGEVSRPARWLANRALALYQRVRRHSRVIRMLRAVTGSLRHDLAYWAYTHQAIRDVDAELLSPEAFPRLEALYREEVHRLANLLGHPPPWPRFFPESSP